MYSKAAVSSLGHKILDLELEGFFFLCGGGVVWFSGVNLAGDSAIPLSHHSVRRLLPPAGRGPFQQESGALYSLQITSIQLF